MFASFHSKGTIPSCSDMLNTCASGVLILFYGFFLKSQVVSLQTAHSWANAGVLLGDADACIGSGVAFEAI